MIESAHFAKWLSTLLAEIFGVSATPFGYILDNGTGGLLGAVGSLNAETASTPLAPGRATIAAHCAHVLFILRLVGAYEQGQKPNEDWAGSWSTQTVDALAWDALRADLRTAYETLIACYTNNATWPESRTDSAMMLLAHCAYHVGEIRQMIGLLAVQKEQADGSEVEALYRQMLDAWNRRNAADFAALFDEDGISIGFDGSMLVGRVEIAASLGDIFAHHITPVYIAKVREVRRVAPGSAILRAVTGLVPDGKGDIVPALNSVQSLVAVQRAGTWRIANFQNTPAQFHGRPDLSDALTAELRALL